MFCCHISLTAFKAYILSYITYCNNYTVSHSNLIFSLAWQKILLAVLLSLTSVPLKIKLCINLRNRPIVGSELRQHLNNYPIVRPALKATSKPTNIVKNRPLWSLHQSSKQHGDQVLPHQQHFLDHDQTFYTKHVPGYCWSCKIFVTIYWTHLRQNGICAKSFCPLQMNNNAVPCWMISAGMLPYLMFINDVTKMSS